MLQGRSVQKLHGDERLGILVANVINRADIGVVQCGRRLGFPPESGKRLRVTGHFLRQELESDETTQPCVLGLVDDTHPAAAELLDDAIVRDRLADHVQNMLWRKSRQVNETRGVVSRQKEVNVKRERLTQIVLVIGSPVPA